MSDWQPPVDLTRLLEALASEIGSSSDNEVMIAGLESTRAMQHAPRPVRAMLQRLRELVDAALGEPQESGEPERRMLVVEGEGACELRHRPH